MLFINKANATGVFNIETFVQPKKDVKEKKQGAPPKQTEPKVKAIKEVPKARNQAKPKVVAPKMKPVKIIKPKINGKGPGK